jgi:hypothetical protein
MTTLTLKFRGVEADLLDKMIVSGLFNTKSEAVRSALVHYSLDLGLLGKEKLWKDIKKFPSRKVSPKQLAKDLENLENEM